MKLRSLLLFTALLSAPLLHAQDSPLEKQMQTLAQGTRKLSTQVSDPTKQRDSVRLIESLKKAALDSKNLEPRKTASIPAADREKFLTAYRAQMQKLIDAFTQIEDAVKAGQYDQAKSLLGNIRGIMQQGHADFKQD